MALSNSTPFRCPNCGGSRAIEVGNGLLQCTGCGIEMPASNTSQNVSPAGPAGVPAWRKWLYLPMISMLGLSGYYVVQAFRSGNLASQLPNIVTSRGSNYGWTSSDHGIYVDKKKQPGLFIIGTRHLKSGRNTAVGDGPYLVFYSLPQYNPVHQEALEDLPYIENHPPRFKVRKATDGRYYAVLNNKALLRIDPTNFSLQDLTPALLKQPLFAGRKLKIDDLSSTPDALFEIQLSNRESYFYNPTVNKLYTTKEALLAEPGSGAAVGDTTVGFAFSQRSVFWEDKPTHLLRYVSAYSKNSPAAKPYFSWAGTHKFSFEEELPPVLVSSTPVRSFKEFGPEQPWYNARVLYWDSALVILLSTQTEDANSTQTLQALNARNGKNVFSLPLKQDYPTDVVRYKKGFLIKESGSVLLLSNSGQVTAEIQTN